MKEELRHIFHSGRFIGAVMIMLLCYSGYTVLDWMYCYELDVAIRPSALQEVVGCIFFGGVMLLLPLCAALPSSISQVEEMQSAFIDLRVIRKSLKRYTAYKLSSAFLSGAVAMGLAFCLHSILWNIIATPCNTLLNDYLAIPFSEDCVYYAWQPICYSLPIYIWMMLAISFCGGIWAIVGITAAVYVQDKLLAIAVPFCIYYLWHSGLPNAILGFNGIPHPADLYNDALTVNTICTSLAAYAVLAIICIILYSTKLKRRHQDNA